MSIGLELVSGIKEHVINLSPYIIKADDHCVGSGRFGDVYKGVLIGSGSETLVAIKVVRPVTGEAKLLKATKQLKREMAVWQGLLHVNIVPFLGVSDTFGRMPALISLWMENGQLNDYLTDHPYADRGSIVKGLASGLLYLHTRQPKITHGDIKTANTLVDRAGHPRLCDFGLSRMLSDESLWMTTTVNPRGSVRWMAPELLDGTEVLPTSESDVYAFAMTEVITGNIPYHRYRMDGAVIMAVTARKELPNRPTEICGSYIWRMSLDDLWECLTRCWDHEPSRRPKMEFFGDLFRLEMNTSNIADLIHSVHDLRLEFSSDKPWEGHKNRVNSVAFSPDGQRIVSGSRDKTVRVWNVATGDVLSVIDGHTDEVSSVVFSVDGKRIASGSFDKTIRVWDVETGEGLSSFSYRSPVHSLAFSPNGKLLALGTDNWTVRICDAETGDDILGETRVASHTGRVSSVAFSPDGLYLASGSHDRSVKVWNAYSRRMVSGPFQGHSFWVSSVAFSPDGTRIASGSHDKTIRVWNTFTGELVSGPFEGHRDWVNSVAFSPDGLRIASGSLDKTIRVWDAATGEVLVTPFEGHTHSISSVVFSPDGRRIASGSRDWTVRLWSALIN